MFEAWQARIRRNHRRIFWICSVCLGLLVVAHGASARYYYNFIGGAFPFDATDAEQTADGLRYWVRASAPVAHDTGYQFVYTVGEREIVAYSYAALEIEVEGVPRYLLVRVEGDFMGKPARTYTGILSDTSRHVLQSLDAQQPEVFLPVVLHQEDARAFRNPGYVGIAGTLLILIVCGYGAIIGRRRSTAPQRHPMLHALSRFDAPLAATFAKIEAALQTAHPVHGNLHLTDIGIIYHSPMVVQVMQYADIVWLVPRVLQAGNPKTYTLFIYDRHGEQITQRLGELALPQVMAQIQQRAPWAFAGDAAQIAQRWREARPELIAEVIQRRDATGTPPAQPLEGQI